MKWEEVKLERDVLLEEKRGREEDELRRLDAAQKDIQMERETIQAINQSLDESNQDLKQRMAEEIAHRLVFYNVDDIYILRLTRIPPIWV